MAGTADSLGKIESVVKSGGQRFVANNVDAGFEKGLGGSVVEMVWRHDGDGVNARFSLRLRRSHFRKTAVGPLWDDVKVQSGGPSAIGIRSPRHRLQH